MKNNIVDKIRKFVEEECKKPSNKYGYETFADHFMPMRNYAVKLAEENSADLEVVEIAAWLHDIGSIVYGRENHHITGAEIAEKKLKELGYSFEKINLVKRCILNHRGSKEEENSRRSIEERIIVEADALSTFDSIEGKFRAAFSEGLSQKEAKENIKQKYINKWNQLSEKGKELVRNKYYAIRLLLG